MLILIDYENVKNAGLTGAEFLNKSDKVIIFYSSHVPTMQRFNWEHLINSGCELEIVKLVNDGKNGLDFYIACKLAEEIGSGYDGKISIISLDKGFNAVCDYWKYRGKVSINIAVCKDIRNGLKNDRNSLERARKLEMGFENIKIDTEYLVYKERQRIEHEVADVFKGTKYDVVIPQITNIIMNNVSPKSRYIDSLKAFGKIDGLRIYNIIKTEVV